MAALTTTAFILLTVTLFLIGLVIGIIFSESGDGDITKSDLKRFVAIVVTLGWITATIAGIVLPTYSMSPLIHGLMGAIVGYFFTEDGLNFQIGGD